MDIAGLADFTRAVSAEGAVLLKNDGNILPVRDERIAVFGRTQINYYKSGTGSGGAVNVRKTINILDGLRQNPHIILNDALTREYERLVKENPVDYSNTFEADFSDKEIELDDSLVADARKFSEKAVIVLGRVSGEAYDNVNGEGSYLLTRKERSLIETVKKYFDKIAVLVNSGNIIDLRWVEEYKIPSVMLVWQGGQYGGKAVADLLSGDAFPSGRLSDTIAYRYEDYPSAGHFGDKERVLYTEDIYVGYRYFETFAKDRVMYPFGYGLSYTEFELIPEKAEVRNGEITVSVNVKNIGNHSGKEVVQVYFGAPQGRLGKPARCLAAFAKTKRLEPGERQRLTVSYKIADMASYDDSGVTGNAFCYVLEEGGYDIYIGNNVRDAKKVYTYIHSGTEVISRHKQIMAPVTEFDRLTASDAGAAYEPVPLRRECLEERIVRELPKAYEITGDRGIRLKDVYDGKADLKSFIAQLSENDLAAVVRGEGMLNPRVTPGTASCFGGVTDELIGYGIVSCSTADGPSGIRMDCGEFATNLPCGTLQACTWNPDILERMYKMESIELEMNNIDAQLGPGMNIHRNPLCGRNFEYFSEDPLLSGTTAAAIVRGIQSGNSAATIKHFACNNQEYARNEVEAVVSERALREIYLKGFEIAVKTANPRAVMTSYNPINGKWSASNYDLTTTVLRGEWGFRGIVMTDWWAVMNKVTGGEPSVKYKAAMVRAQNDIHMCTENFTAGDNSRDDITEELKNGGLTIGELQRCAENICGFILKSHTFLTAMGVGPSEECRAAYEAAKKEEVNGAGADTSDDLGDFFLNNNCTLICNVSGTPGSTVSCRLFVKQSASYTLYFYAASDSNELAQLSIFASAGENRLAVSMRGTSGQWKELTAGRMYLEKGECDLEISFGSSNFGAVKLSQIHFIREGN